jgi:cytochrome c biogenesis protein CcmG/thiol:disulfide interchange protein DsbE
MKKTVIALFVFLFSMTSTNFAQSKGQKLPSIEIKDLSGSSVDISKYSDNEKITVISFWATWCTPCKKELNNISEIYEEWVDDYDVEVVAISIDDSRSTSKVKAYINGQGWDFEVLLDSNSDLKRALNFQTVPFTLLLNQEGEIVYRHTGYVEGDENILEDEIAKLAE